jgi:hypothetical protein
LTQELLNRATEIVDYSSVGLFSGLKHGLAIVSESSPHSARLVEIYDALFGAAVDCRDIVRGKEPRKWRFGLSSVPVIARLD